jgi:hypothetical protein
MRWESVVLIPWLWGAKRSFRVHAECGGCWDGGGGCCSGCPRRLIEQETFHAMARHVHSHSRQCHYSAPKIKMKPEFGFYTTRNIYNATDPNSVEIFHPTDNQDSSILLNTGARQINESPLDDLMLLTLLLLEKNNPPSNSLNSSHSPQH